eukprot:TRINITY_DN2403_c0_g2_i1.p1 TRINITY_DN2403_c0_g2~~TRINITY_DN2403_c0_g2_i1.p1  ORF type:complete len:348 (+),score=138.75 TRINITY_DN2403_c0_g2_i1:83-1045(+)
MASEKVGPSHLFPLIQQFLQINNLTKTLKCFVKETNTEENKLKAPEEDLIQIYKIYLENRPKKRKVPDSPEENQKKKTPKKETPKKETEKKEDSEDSDSDSDSESESEEESKEDQKKKKGKEAQKKEDKGKDKEKVKEKENGKKDKKEEEKKGKEKEKEKEEKGKKKEKETKGKKTKDSDSESSDSSESESESDSGSESEASAKKTPKKQKAEPSTPSSTKVESTPTTPTTPKTPSQDQRRLSTERFQRVKAEEVTFVKPELQDNSFQAKGESWGAKANAVLSTVHGKGFRHEKTKKKRGTYKGGIISTAVNSIKFDDAD